MSNQLLSGKFRHIFLIQSCRYACATITPQLHHRG
ncbi:hypothetical protein EcE24377A_1264 [Escherichia coli O139:H28 str. E24377A]|uniref:Uncharacterized protein n=1 Tax=Escherichia coli O139:H28 (strain E24377A / ETEC) TaxID=331111 RepID=A7ZKP5_ECO24|nr:hypothetical protein EcE24377A_1264 [Escherichia coli O139:H28 str. E24377A]